MRNGEFLDAVCINKSSQLAKQNSSYAASDRSMNTASCPHIQGSDLAVDIPDGGHKPLPYLGLCLEYASMGTSIKRMSLLRS